MYEVFAILIFIPLILLGSYITEHFLWKADVGPFNPIKNTLCYIGVAIHEFSHFLMALIVGVRPKGIQIKLRSKEGIIAPHGRVRVDAHGETFLQAALISLAPLFFSTWLFFWMLDILFIENVNIFLFFIAIFLICSLFFGAAPSVVDFTIIWHSFKEDPKYSLYQILLLIISGFLVWILLLTFEVALIIDLLYYLFVGIMYNILKHLIRGIGYLIHLGSKANKNGHRYLKYGVFIRHRFRPTKPYKLGIEEAHW